MAQSTVPSEAIIEIATRALNTPRGISIEFPTEGAAIYWSQRFNTVKAKQIKGDPAHEWRTLSCRREGNLVLIQPADAYVLDLPIKDIE